MDVSKLCFDGLDCRGWWRGDSRVIEVDEAIGDREKCAHLRSHFCASLCPIVSWRVRPPVEFLVQPTEHARLSGAERLDPAVHQKLRTAALERNLFSLRHDRSAAAQIQ